MSGLRDLGAACLYTAAILSIVRILVWLGIPRSAFTVAALCFCAVGLVALEMVKEK